MPVIAIAREIGAGAVEVADQVARELGASVVDRRIIDEVARRLQIPPEDAQSLDETPTKPLEWLLSALVRANPSPGFEESPGWMPPYPNDPAFDARRASRRITEEVIREAARSGNAVIVGRNASFILKDDPGVLRVFLRAARATRVAAVRTTLKLDAKAAERQVKESDVNWGSYARDHYRVDWRDPSNYDLLVDTSRLGTEGSARVILAAAAHVGRRD